MKSGPQCGHAGSSCHFCPLLTPEFVLTFQESSPKGWDMQAHELWVGLTQNVALAS
jgi:hypothetical protein